MLDATIMTMKEIRVEMQAALILEKPGGRLDLFDGLLFRELLLKQLLDAVSLLLRGIEQIDPCGTPEGGFIRVLDLLQTLIVQSECVQHRDNPGSRMV